MRNAARGSFFALLLLAAAVPARAATGGLRHYTAEDGLPQAQITALVQDDRGYVWAGTLAGGLARYNGHRWELFDTTSGLPSVSVTCLAAGADLVFVGTSSGLVKRLAGGWEAIAVPPGHVVTSGLVLGATEAYFGTSKGLLAWSGGRDTRLVAAGDPAAGAAVDALALAPDGSIWLGGRSLRRLVRGPAPRVETLPGVPAGRVWSIAFDAAQEPVVSIAEAGVFRRRGGAFVRVGDDVAPGRRAVALLADGTEPGTIWIGTDDRGAFVAREDRVEAFGRKEGLPDLHVNVLLQDREGLLWLGTDDGLVKRGPAAFDRLDESDGLPPKATVFGMTEDTEGGLWMAAYDDGVLRRSRDGRVRRFGTEDGLPAPRVLDVAADPRGGVWVATSRGLAHVDGDAVTRLTPGEGVPRPAYMLQPFGDALVVGGNGGLAIVRGTAVERVPGIDDDVAALAVAADGTLWTGGPGWGAVAVRGGRIAERITRADGLPSDQVTHVRPTRDGGLWIATDRGAWHRAADGTRSVLDRRSGLPDDYVYWVGEDHDGGLWLGTNKGVAHRPRGTTSLVRYTTRDGLGSDECNDDGFFVDGSGAVHIASVGVSIFRGAVKPRREVDPPVQVEQFLVNGVPSADGAVLGPDPGPVSFRFAALSFADEAAVRFQYRLLGAGAEWREAGAGQYETTYGGLGPGAYRFEVTAHLPDGRASATPGVVAFRIRPHWWQTPAAAIVAVLLTLCAVAAFVRLRERRLVAARLRLERLVEERTHELRLANERLGELAVTDELTGLSNRRRLTEGLSAAVALAKRQKAPLSVALCDLDRFKELNDTMGHGAGDRALVSTAGALRGALREVDLLGRWGGEEFLVVLPSCELAGAREAGERLRRAVEDMELRNSVTGRVLTVSIGVAALTEGVESATDLVRRADQALYKAKDGGRNRVMAFEVEGAS